MTLARLAFSPSPSGRSISTISLRPSRFGLGAGTSDGGTGLHHALNLDGGPSTQLHVIGAGQEWSVPDPGGVASAVTFAERRDA